MKKVVSLALAILMIFSLVSLVGCGEEKVKFGLGVYSSIAEIKNATAEVNGGGEAATTVAAVLVDKNNKILDCKLDTAANKIEFTAAGKAAVAEEFKTKYEQGKDYGMVAYGGAKKEWYEQADAFVSVIKGKTVDEIKALKTDKGTGTEEVTTAGCTVAIGEFVLAVEKAVKNAADSEATSKSTLKLGVVSSVTDKKDATAEANGAIEITTTVTAAALNDKNEIVASKVDAVSPKVEFDAKGASKTEYGKEITTKFEAGKDYGMVAYGGAKLEWFEQANAFAAQIVGKKAADIAGLSDETGKPGEALQTAGCTINVNDMVKSAVKAATV